jgi:hypothetical protein
VYATTSGQVLVSSGEICRHRYPIVFGTYVLIGEKLAKTTRWILNTQRAGRLEGEELVWDWTRLSAWTITDAGPEDAYGLPQSSGS